MDKKEIEEKYGKILKNWSFSTEYTEKTSIYVKIIGLLILGASFIYSIFSENYLFSMIIFLIVFIYYFESSKKIKEKTKTTNDFYILEDGILIDEEFFDWDSIKEFYIIYYPDEKIKKIYFKLKNILISRIYINIENQNPNKIREILNQYIEENLERKYEHVSDRIEKFFKF
ncbi:hypothetical protein K9M42_00065 [Patescibacteria group bacterium]|nr:hypothetical protein [Patescibacteria group bacterium]